MLLDRLGLEHPVVQATSALYAGETALRIDSILPAREALASLAGVRSSSHPLGRGGHTAVTD